MYYLMGTVIKEKHPHAAAPKTLTETSKLVTRKVETRAHLGLSEADTQRTESDSEILDELKKPIQWKRSPQISPEHKIAYAKMQQLEMETALKRLNLRMENIEARIQAPKAPPSTSSKMSPRGSLKRFQDRVDHYKRSLMVPRYNPNTILHPKPKILSEERSVETRREVESLTIPDQETESTPSPLSPHNEYFKWFNEDPSDDEFSKADEEDPLRNVKLVQNEEALVKHAEKLVASIRKTREINIRLEAAIKSIETETVHDSGGFADLGSDETKEVRSTQEAM